MSVEGQLVADSWGIRLHIVLELLLGLDIEWATICSIIAYSGSAKVIKYKLAISGNEGVLDKPISQLSKLIN